MHKAPRSDPYHRMKWVWCAHLKSQNREGPFLSNRDALNLSAVSKGYHGFFLTQMYSFHMDWLIPREQDNDEGGSQGINELLDVVIAAGISA